MTNFQMALIIYVVLPLLALLILFVKARRDRPGPAQCVEDTPQWWSDARAWSDMRDSIRTLERSRPGDDVVWLAELARYPSREDLS